MKLEAPCLLVASPELADPNFKRSVILLCQHSREGSLGFIINRPLEVVLGKLLEDCSGLDGLTEQPVYMGGPVQVNSGTIIYNGEGEHDESVHLGGGLYMTGSLEKLKRMCDESQSGPRFCRFFLGYAGWGQGQLEWEIRNHSWFCAPIDVQTVIGTPPDQLWDATMHRMGISVGNLVTPESSILN